MPHLGEMFKIILETATLKLYTKFEICSFIGSNFYSKIPNLNIGHATKITSITLHDSSENNSVEGCNSVTVTVTIDHALFVNFRNIVFGINDTESVCKI